MDATPLQPFVMIIRHYNMRRIMFVALLTFVGATHGYAQNARLKDKTSGSLTAGSINVFYKALFKAFKVAYLHRGTIDWKTVEAETYEHLRQYNSFDSSLTEITNLFDRINATHCLVYRADSKFTVTRKIIPKERYSTQWKEKYNSKPSFEVKLLGGSTATF